MPVRRLGQSEILGVSAGYDFSCARNANGQVRCFGRNDAFQLGDGTDIDRHTPVQMRGVRHGLVPETPGGGASAPRNTGDPRDAHAILAIGLITTIAINLRRRMFRTRSNANGELGLSEQVDVLERAARLGSVGVARALAGEAHACYIAARNARMFCTGANNVGQLGGGFGAPFTSFGFIPAVGLEQAPLRGFTAGAAGDRHTCAIRWGQSLLRRLWRRRRARHRPVRGLSVRRAGGVPGRLVPPARRRQATGPRALRQATRRLLCSLAQSPFLRAFPPRGRLALSALHCRHVPAVLCARSTER